MLSEYLYKHKGEMRTFFIVEAVFTAISIITALIISPTLMAVIPGAGLILLGITLIWGLSWTLFSLGIKAGKKYSIDYYQRVYAYMISVPAIVLVLGFLFVVGSRPSDEERDLGYSGSNEIWSGFWLVALFLTISYWTGIFIEHRKLLRNENSPSDPRTSNLEHEEQIDQIISDYGRFLELGAPIIPDKDLLPHPKELIEAALKRKEQQLCDLGNLYAKENQTERLPALERELDVVQAVKDVYLVTYTQIAPEDKQRVNYFNRSYKNIDKVPESESEEFDKLLNKYFFSRMEQIRN